jgi:capsular polysaccharide biosynthesis protein
MYSALSSDYLQLIQTRPVLEKVIAELGLDMSVDELKGKITATKQGDSRIISISVVDESPVVAKRIADAVAKAAAEQIYTVMDAELVNIVQPGNVPEEPSSPAVMKNTAIVFIIAVFAVCAVIIIRNIVDDTIKTSEDVEKYLGISVIGSIPIFGAEANTDKKKKKVK